VDFFSINVTLSVAKCALKRRINTVDLLLLISSDQQFFNAETIFPFFTKQLILLRRSTVLSKDSLS